MSSITNNPPGQRELVYCHLCREEWYRDEHGLVCPHCRSDFVEIIENTNDPRDPTAPGGDLPEDFEVDSDDGTTPLHDHATAFVRIEGPDFSYTSTQRNFGSRSQQLRNRMATPDAGGDGANVHPDEMMLQLFTNMLRNIVGDVGVAERGPGTPGAQSPRAEGGGQGQPAGSTSPHTHPHTPMPSIFGPTTPLFRLPYDANARLNPRDADSPQPHEETVLDLSTFIASFFAPGAPGVGGDYVHLQADFDRVISQLMEQHQGNAPPPADKEVIDSLPKVKVTEQMVRDGQDCAVCKEDLVEMEEITKLPCNHMYHFDCVSRWLEAHDTCPICRHPVTPETQRPAATPQSPSTTTRPNQSWLPTNTRPLYGSLYSGASSPSGPPPAPPGDHSSGSSSNNSGNRTSGHSWNALFGRRRGNDRS